MPTHGSVDDGFTPQVKTTKVKTSERYQIAPQLESYDLLQEVFAPYVSIISQPNYFSDVVCTDDFGFRHTYRGNKKIEYDSWSRAKCRGLVLGGSFTFGVGATNDRLTVVSQLNASSEALFLNLGIRGGNSTQDIIAALPYISQTEVAVICGGINNLMLTLLFPDRGFEYAPLYGERFFERLCEYDINYVSACASQNFSRISGKSILKELRHRITRKRRTHLGSVPLSLPKNVDLQNAVKRAVNWHQRDAQILKQLIGSKGRVLFFLQPFANATKRELSEEERGLFEILDRIQGPEWDLIKSVLTEFWSHYTEELSRALKSNEVTFVDLNETNFKGWSFVDRVHMTDQGNEQVTREILKNLSYENILKNDT